MAEKQKHTIQQATTQLKDWKDKLEAFNKKVPKPDEKHVQIIQEEEVIPHIDLKGQKKTENKEIVAVNEDDYLDEVEGFEDFNKKPEVSPTKDQLEEFKKREQEEQEALEEYARKAREEDEQKTTKKFAEFKF